jgi:uncharacterized protein (TIGR00251 family)
MVGWIKQGAEGVTVRVWVVPGASKTEVAGLHGDALKVRVAVPAERGRANRAVVRLLAGLLDPAPVRLIAGETARLKMILVGGVDVDVVRERLRP